jgi:hypothetical protein
MACHERRRQSRLADARLALNQDAAELAAQ